MLFSAYHIFAMFELPPFQYKIMTILLHMDIMSPKFYTTNQPLNGFKIPLHRRYKRKGKQQVLAILSFLFYWGWSGGAMVLGKLPVPGRPTCLD